MVAEFSKKTTLSKVNLKRGHVQVVARSSSLNAFCDILFLCSAIRQMSPIHHKYTTTGGEGQCTVERLQHQLIIAFS